jgi:hypothetical protein
MKVWRNKVEPTQIRRDQDMAAVIFSELTQCHAIPYSVRPSCHENVRKTPINATIVDSS